MVLHSPLRLDIQLHKHMLSSFTHTIEEIHTKVEFIFLNYISYEYRNFNTFKI